MSAYYLNFLGDWIGGRFRALDRSDSLRRGDPVESRPDDSSEDFRPAARINDSKLLQLLSRYLPNGE